MLNYWLLLLASAFLGRLPLFIGYPSAKLIGQLMYLVNGKARRIVKSNLRVVLGPSAAEKAVSSTARKVFANVARNYFDLFRLPSTSLAAIERSISVNNWHIFQNAVDAGKGVILATAHLGSFDLVAQLATARNIRFTILIEPLDPRLLALYSRLRASHGHVLAPATPAGLKQLFRTLRSGGVVVIACDRVFNGHGRKVRFMGRQTPLPDGAVELAQRTGAVIVPSYNVRLGSRGRFALHFEEPLYLSGNGGRQPSAEEALQRLATTIESWVRRWSEQWVVFSAVWPEKEEAKVPS